MSTYNHAYSIGFSLDTTTENPYNVRASEVRTAILERLALLSDEELIHEAIDHFDTYTEEDIPMLDLQLLLPLDSN
jgi:hypothetical protein